MRTRQIKIVIDEKGNITAETKGMYGEVCVEELDKILQGIAGEREETETEDYHKEPPAEQTIERG